MNKLFSLLSLLVLTGMISACSGKPNPIPRGYSSYKEPYKSAPGEKASDIGYAFSAEKNQSVLQDMRYAAQDLAERLDERLAFDTDEIYVSQPANNVFYKSFDHLLRAELTHRGYTLSVTPQESKTRIDLGVLDDVTECKDKYTLGNEEKTDYRTAFIQLAISESGEAKDVVDGFYEVPLYGYKQSNAYDVQLPNCREDTVTEKIDQPVAVEAIKLTE